MAGITVTTTPFGVVLDAEGNGAAPTVRAGTPVREVVERFRNDESPQWLLVTTARGRLLGMIPRARLLAMATADELP
ncbi:MAG TPA: hypothetical protein VM143_13605 [Acidimicrobiales bacterium]|nr:hypothetical protein [Acidimicrobiales bacterium]